MEEGVLSACFCDEMIGAPKSSDAYVLGDEPCVDVVRDEVFHDGIDVPVFDSIDPPTENVCHRGHASCNGRVRQAWLGHDFSGQLFALSKRGPHMQSK